MATSRGSSVHFKPLHSPMRCEAHNRRAVNPQYLLPEQDREPNLVVRDGDVAQAYAQKMALASGRARATPKYSPLKEGIVNLADEAPEVLHAKMERWCQEYEAITGERVVACVIHRDEGHIGADDTVHRNVHAHVVVDRTDARGRVVNSIPDGKGGPRRTTITDRKAQGRLVQTMTAGVTGLARGVDARESKRRHIDHHSYRALARQGRLRDADREHELKHRVQDAERMVCQARARTTAVESEFEEARKLIGEFAERFGVTLIGEREADYKALRTAMKGQASQQDYGVLRAANETLRHEREAAQHRADLMGRVKERAAEDSVSAQQALLDFARDMGIPVAGLKVGEDAKSLYNSVRERMKASGVATQQQYSQLRLEFERLLREEVQRRERERARRRRRNGIDGEPCETGGDGQEALSKQRLTRERDEAAQMTIWKDQQGREVLHVTRSRVEVFDHSADVEIAALRIAAKKFDGTISITGGSEFRERVARQAVREGIKIIDTDLVQIVADEQARMARGEPGPVERERRAENHAGAKLAAKLAETREALRSAMDSLEGEDWQLPAKWYELTREDGTDASPAPRPRSRRSRQDEQDLGR